MGSFTHSVALFLALQAVQPPAGAHSVNGRVVRPGDHRMDPIAGIWVTLHRVGSDAQSPIDSTRTDARGRFTFRYRKTGSADAIYFVSGLFQGIAYFTPPLHEAAVTGGEAEITVFDTTSGQVPISVRGRHLVISAVDANAMRAVVEVYDLVNDSSVTRIASGSGAARAAWSAPLIQGTTGAAVREGDFPEAAIAFDDGRVSIHAPFAPGLKQLAFGYSVPARQFPLKVPFIEATGVLEVLLEEKTGSAAGGGLKEVEPVTVEGRSFRRFLASEVPAGAVSVVDLPPPPPQTDPRYLVALTFVLGAVMIGVLARALKRR